MWARRKIGSQAPCRRVAPGRRGRSAAAFAFSLEHPCARSSGFAASERKRSTGQRERRRTTPRKNTGKDFSTGGGGGVAVVEGQNAWMSHSGLPRNRRHVLI